MAVFFISLYCHFCFCILFVLNYVFVGIFLIYFAYLVTRYLDVEVNPSPWAALLIRCRIMFSNINGLHGNYDELAELRLPGYCVPVLLPRGSRSNGLEIVLYSRSGLALSRLSTFECY